MTISLAAPLTLPPSTLAAKTIPKNKASLEQQSPSQLLQFIIGRWVKNLGVKEIEEEWSEIDFGQLEGTHREWQGQRLVSQTKTIIYRNKSGLGAYTTDDFPNFDAVIAKNATVTSTADGQVDIRFGTNADPHLNYSLLPNGQLQLVKQDSKGSQGSFTFAKRDGERAMDYKLVHQIYNPDVVVRRRFDLFSQYWSTGTPEKLEDGCAGIPSFRQPPGFPYGPVPYVSYVPTQSEAARVYAAGSSMLGRVEADEQVCTAVHIGDGMFLTSAHATGTMRAGKPFVPRQTIRVNGYKAEFLAADPGADVALLSVKQQANIPHIEVGSCDNLQHGQLLYTIGFPARSKVSTMFCEHETGLKVTKQPKYTDLDAVDGLIEKTAINGTFSGFAGAPIFYVDRQSKQITLAGVQIDEGEAVTDAPEVMNHAVTTGTCVEHMQPLGEALDKAEHPPVVVSSYAQIKAGDKGFEIRMLRWKPVNAHAADQRLDK